MVHKFIMKFKRINKSEKQNIRVVIEQVSAMPGKELPVCLILDNLLEF